MDVRITGTDVTVVVEVDVEIIVVSVVDTGEEASEVIEVCPIVDEV